MNMDRQRQEGYSRIHNRSNGEHIYDKRDVADTVMPIKIKHLLVGAGFLMSLTAGAVYGWVNLKGDVTVVSARLSKVECQNQMLVDVVVYKKPPEQPKCRE